MGEAYIYKTCLFKLIMAAENQSSLETVRGDNSNEKDNNEAKVEKNKPNEPNEGPSGKRERKKTERLVFPAEDESKKKLFEIPKGSGTPLGECPVIGHNLSSVKAEDLKNLHKLLFKTLGQIMNIKKNIKKFNGFAFEADSGEFDKKMKSLIKLGAAELKKICHVLDLTKEGTKEDICKRILEFLVKPEPSGRTPPDKKAKKKIDSKDKEDNLSEVKKPVKRKSKNLIDSPKKMKLTEGDVNRLLTKSPKKKKNPISSALIDSADISSTDSETEEKKNKVKDNPCAAEDSSAKDISKPTFPTDEELVQAVEGILKGADLDKVTMKIVCRSIYDKYPGVDLTGKKDFIKSTVKKIIS